MPYQYCTDGLYCYSATTTGATIDTVGCLVKTYGSQFSNDGTRIYSNTFTNDSIIAQVPSDPGYSAVLAVLTTPDQWNQTFPLFNGPLNRSAVWFDAGCDGVKDTISGDLTISHYFYNSGVTNQYYLGFGAWTGPPPASGGGFEIKINGDIVVSGGTNAMNNRFWHIIPVTLLSCDNYINMTVTSTETNQDGFGYVIYDNSYSEIVSATNDLDLNIIFSTTKLLTTDGTIGPFVKAYCPANYMLSADTLTATCINTVYTGCTCVCCDSYNISRVSGDENFVYYDCNGEVQIITDLSSGTRRVCACSIVTPKTLLSTNNWVSDDGNFRILLTSECDPTCIPIPDGPPPEPDPEPTCNDCGFSGFSIGYDHTTALSGGTLWSWGQNSDGQLGQGNTTNYNTPQQIGSSTDWVSTSSGYKCTFAINTGGELWVCGLSNGGGGDQLGLNNASISYNTLQQVTSPGISGWSKISSRNGTTIALRTDGTIWSTGYNEFYQLGLNDTTDRTQFEQIGVATNWSDISFGIFHGLALTTSGDVYSWGSNNSGLPTENPLGLGASVIDQQATTPTLVTVGNSINYPNYPATNIVTNIATGSYHSIALTNTGSIWGWGRTIEGQLDCASCGPTDPSKPFPMDGKYSPGDNYSSGGGYINNSGYTYIGAAGDVTVAMTSGLTINGFVSYTTANGVNWTPNSFGDIRVWTWGYQYGDNLKTLLQDDLDRAEYEVKNNWCSVWFGKNGNGDSNDQMIFFAKDNAGVTYVWGDNSWGQLGVGSTPLCLTCSGDEVGPIEVVFNNCGDGNTCNCVEYVIVNYSTNEIFYTYIDCNSATQNDSVPRGGPGPSAQTKKFCACSVSIEGNYNPNLVIVSTNQIPC